MSWYKKYADNNALKDFVQDTKEFDLERPQPGEISPGLTYFPKEQPQQARQNVMENQDIIDAWINELKSTDLDYFSSQLTTGLMSAEDYQDLAYHVMETDNFYDILSKYTYATLSVGDIDFLDENSKKDALISLKNIESAFMKINKNQLDSFVSSIMQSKITRDYDTMLQECIKLWKNILYANERFGLFIKHI